MSRTARAQLLMTSALVAIALTSSPSYAAPSKTDNGEPEVTPQIGQVDLAFEAQDFERVVTLLEPLLAQAQMPEHPAFTRLLELMGGSLWFIEGRRSEARQWFTKLLKLKSEHRLNPNQWPRPLIDSFEELRKLIQLIDPKVDPKGPEKAPDDATTATVMRTTTVTRNRAPTLAFLMPFGVGQFSNQETEKGLLLAVLQGIGLATSIATFFAAQSYESPESGLIHPSDLGKAEILRAVNWAGLGLFAATWSYSVVDGLVHRLPDEERVDTLLPPPPAAKDSSFRFNVSPLPGGAAIQAKHTF